VLVSLDLGKDVDVDGFSIFFFFFQRILLRINLRLYRESKVMNAIAIDDTNSFFVNASSKNFQSGGATLKSLEISYQQ
jgi:hypothetical protein